MVGCQDEVTACVKTLGLKGHWISGVLRLQSVSVKTDRCHITELFTHPRDFGHYSVVEEPFGVVIT